VCVPFCRVDVYFVLYPTSHNLPYMPVDAEPQYWSPNSLTPSLQPRMQPTTTARIILHLPLLLTLIISFLPPPSSKTSNTRPHPKQQQQQATQPALRRPFFVQPSFTSLCLLLRSEHKQNKWRVSLTPPSPARSEPSTTTNQSNNNNNNN
jgi:hypothetical protein